MSAYELYLNTHHLIWDTWALFTSYLLPALSWIRYTDWMLYRVTRSYVLLLSVYVYYYKECSVRSVLLMSVS